MRWVWVVVVSLMLGPAPAAAQTQAASELEGLWVVERTYAPVLRGELVVTRQGDTWRASIGRQSAEASSPVFSFANHGGFCGEILRNTLRGVWIQPTSDAEERDDPTATAQPIVLTRDGANRWRATVTSLDGRFRVYLRVFGNDEGALIAAFRNHEINSNGRASHFRVTEEGDVIELLARFDDGREVRHAGMRLRDPDRIRIFWPDVGSDLEFQRIEVSAAADYLPRRIGAAPYVYQRPVQLDDGWRTANARSVGLDESALAGMVQRIASGDPSARRPSLIHSVLVAHRGRLVLEEYFHGYTRETPHDIRSVGKTFASILLGAAMESGAPISPETHVYDLMAGLGPFANPDPRRERITIAHLLTHTAGLACNDNDDNSPGNEGVLWRQSDPNFWRYTLNLAQAHEPGERYAYCSANLNLVGGALNAATNESLLLRPRHRAAAAVRAVLLERDAERRRLSRWRRLHAPA